MSYDIMSYVSLWAVHTNRETGIRFTEVRRYEKLKNPDWKIVKNLEKEVINNREKRGYSCSETTRRFYRGHMTFKSVVPTVLIQNVFSFFGASFIVSLRKISCICLKTKNLKITIETTRNKERKEKRKDKKAEDRR